MTNRSALNQPADEHDFTLVLSGTEALSPAQEDALFEAGCDDATISLQNGRVYLSFSREAESLSAAILPAIAQLAQAKIGMEVLRVDSSDLVSVADIARRTKRTRQCIHQYISGERGPGGFPPPECSISEHKFLWSWGEVATWLLNNNMIKVAEQRDASAVQFINNALSFVRQKRENPELVDAVNRCIPCM